MSELGKLCDHTECYRELCHVERERDDLRLEMAQLRAAYVMLKDRLRLLGVSSVEPSPVDAEWR